MQLMGLRDLSLIFAMAIPMGGIFLAIHWLWIRPQVRAVVKEELESCRVSRACNVGGSLEIQLHSIDSKLDAMAREMAYIRSRVDQHVNGHRHDP